MSHLRVKQVSHIWETAGNVLGKMNWIIKIAVMLYCVIGWVFAIYSNQSSKDLSVIDFGGNFVNIYDKKCKNVFVNYLINKMKYPQNVSHFKKALTFIALYVYK